MSKKKLIHAFKEIEESLKAERIYEYPEESAIEISLRNMTHEEKIQEASKPLYLKRYE